MKTSVAGRFPRPCARKDAKSPATKPGGFLAWSGQVAAKASS